MAARTTTGSRAAGDAPLSLDDLLRLLLETMQGAFRSRLVEVGLSPPQAITLRHLDQPAPMGALAAILLCDASTMTGIADRLEERGLVERRADPNDRRVKLLALTDKGRDVRGALENDLTALLPGLRRLTKSERRQFEALLWQVLAR